MIGSWLKRQANTKVPSHFSTQGVAVPKSVSKKTVPTQVSFELNPLNATMRAAFATSPRSAGSLRKATPAIFCSLLGASGIVWTANNALANAPDPVSNPNSAGVGTFLVDEGQLTNNSITTDDPTAYTVFLQQNATNYSVSTNSSDLANFTVTVEVNVSSKVLIDLDGYANATNATANATANLSNHDLNFGALVVNASAADGFDNQSSKELVEVFVGGNNRVGNGTIDTGINVIGGSTFQGVASLTITNDGTVRGNTLGSGANASGVSIGSSGIILSATVVNNGTIESGNDGIRVRGIGNSSLGYQDGFGSLTIDNKAGKTINGDDTVGSREGYGVRVSSFWSPGDDTVTSVYGDVNVTNAGTINGVAAAILVEQVRGQTLIDNSGRIGRVDEASQTPVVGIQIRDVGNVGLLTDVVTITNRLSGIIEGTTGILISNVTSTTGVNESGDVSIVNEGTGQILGTAGPAINIADVDDDLRIFNNGTATVIRGVSTTDVTGHGVVASSIGGFVEIVNQGRIEGENPIDVTSPADGIRLSSVTSYVSIVSNGTIRGYDDGVDLGSISGGVSIVNRGTIEARNDDAIDLEFVGTAVQNTSVSIDNFGSLIAGSGSLPGSKAITINEVGSQGDLTSSTVTIRNRSTGTIRNVASNSNAEVISISNVDNSATNTVLIDNQGNITGQISISDVAGTVDFNNSGTWRVSGTNAFVGTTATGAGNAVTIRNTDGGVIQITGNSSISNITTFENAGGLIDLTEDSNATSTTLNINFKGSTFRGQTVGTNAESRIFVNADLSGTVSESNLDSDYLYINDGTVTGVTKVTLEDTQPLVAGVYVPAGRTLIRVDNGLNTDSSQFVLSTGPVNKGLWQYDLFSTTVPDGEDYIDGNDGSTQNGFDRVWRIASSPSEYAHELPVLHSAAQESWHQSSAAWLDHTNNIRMRLDGGNAVKGGAWARVVGADIERKNTNRFTQPVYNQVISQQNDYNQDIYGVMFGADGAIDMANGGTWLLGLTGGVVQSKVGFTTSTTTMDYTAGSVGAYASYVQGGGFFNALLKGDIGSTDYKMSNGEGISANESFKTNAIGLMLDGGYRFRSGIAFIEPSLSVAAVNTNVKDKEFLATKVDFSNGNSLRTKLTLATGFSGSIGGTRWEPSLSLSAVNESGGENDVNLTSGGQDPVKVQDRQVKTYGQVGLGLKIIGSKGSSGFLMVEHAPSRSDNDATKGDAKRESTTVSAGVKVTW